MQQDWRQPLRIAKYMDEPIVNRIKNEASRMPGFEEILKGRNLLCAGTQLLTNDQIWKVIKKIVEPLNAEEVRRYLAQSVYPSAQYAKFKEAKAIEENFAEFRNSWTNYDELFLKMVNLIMGKKSKRHFPQDLFGGSGRSDAKEKGWIQYYFEGSPNPNVAHRIFKREVSQQERKACKEFDVFRRLFFMALEKTEIGIRKESTRKSVFSGQDPGKISEPPQERKFSGKPRSKFRSSRVHQIDDDYGEDPYDEEWTREKAEPDPEEAHEEDEQLERDREEHASEGDEEASASGDEGPEEAVPVFLAGISMDKTGKRPPPCYMFAKEGKCTFPNCKYSHHPSDIKMYLELDKHKDFLGSVVKKAWDKTKSSTSNNYSQATTGAKGTSPGVKPKYGSILRGSGSVARKTS